jgi:hypothetical protein
MRPDWSNYGTYDESNNPELWDGVVGYWSPSLGPTGSRLYDVSRSNNWGSLTNMDVANDWIISDGQYALEFDGVDDFCSLGSVQPLNAATMSCWCKLRLATPTSQSRTSPPFAQDSSNFGSHYVWTDGMIYMEVLRTGRATATPSPLVNRASWHLFTIVNNGSRYQLYQNNIRIHDSESTAIGTNNFFIGRNSARLPVLNITYSFDGLVSDAILWDRGLTANEITNIYQLGRGGMLQRKPRRRIYSFTQPTTIIRRDRASLINRPPIEPSYHNGFAPRDGEPLYPNLWKGVVGAWSPSLGPTGTRLIDHGPYKNHGTLTNMDAATDWVVSGGKYALDFDGSNDIVNCGNPALYAGLSSLSLACWISDRAVSGQRRYMSKWSGSGFILMHEASAITFYLTTGGTLRTLSTGVLISAGWQHLVATWDGSSMRVYLNGLQIGSTVSATGVFGNSTNALWFSGGQNTFQQLNGLGADYGVWNRALSANEVRSLYQLGRGGMFAMRQQSPKTTSELSQTWVKNNGEWKQTEGHYIKQNGVWVPTNPFIKSNNWR